MRSRARQEKRLLQEQESVGAQRSERLEQKKLGAHSNLEVIIPKTKVRVRQVEDEDAPARTQPRHVARPGKPLKRVK